MPRMQGVAGRAVLVYVRPATTPQTGYNGHIGFRTRLRQGYVGQAKSAMQTSMLSPALQAIVLSELNRSGSVVAVDQKQRRGQVT